jgi:hypothetical protein
MGALRQPKQPRSPALAPRPAEIPRALRAARPARRRAACVRRSSCSAGRIRFALADAFVALRDEIRSPMRLATSSACARSSSPLRMVFSSVFCAKKHTVQK